MRHLVLCVGILFVSVCLLTLRADDPVPPVAAPRPHTFTLEARVRLREALTALEMQTGVHVEDETTSGDRQISLDCKSLTFWQAIDAIASSSDTAAYLYPRNGRITLVERPRGHLTPQVSYDGFFRCAVKKIVASRDLETGHHSCTVSLEVAWEPQLQPLFLETRPAELKLADDQMRPIPVQPDGSSVASVDGRMSLVTDVQLPGLPRSAVKIGSLRGQFHVIAPTKMLLFRFPALDELAKAAADSPARNPEIEKVRCRIAKVDLLRDRWTVRVALDYPPGNKELESYQSWVVNNEMVLVSEDGKRRLPASDYVLESATTTRAVLSYHFRDRDRQPRGKPEDWRLTYRAPAAIIEWPVRFSFKDIPLP
jgi:hypothetical protein